MDAIERYARSLERRMGGIGPLNRTATVRALCTRIGKDLRGAEYRRGLRSGRCRMRGCDSRYGIPRVTIDTRDPERIDRSAVLECALCGHIWTAMPVPDLSLRDGAMPRVLITLILPPARGRGMRIGYLRNGRAIRTGSDALTVPNASYRDVGLAHDAWSIRGERAAEKREAARIASRDALILEQRQRTEQAAVTSAALAAAGSPLA